MDQKNLAAIHVLVFHLCWTFLKKIFPFEKFATMHLSIHKLLFLSINGSIVDVQSYINYRCIIWKCWGANNFVSILTLSMSTHGHQAASHSQPVSMCVTGGGGAIRGTPPRAAHTFALASLPFLSLIFASTPELLAAPLLLPSCGLREN